jgi:hypothetical protein
MADMHINPSDVDGSAHAPRTPRSPRSGDGRAKGARRPAVVAGLAALLLAGPTAASTVAPEAGDNLAAFHDQFTGAFTPGAINLEEPCCSVKLPQ